MGCNQRAKCPLAPQPRWPCYNAGIDHYHTARLACLMSRFCALVFGVVIGASVTHAEWPIPTADGTIWEYALTREGEAKLGTLTRQAFAPENPDEQNTSRIETAINGIGHSTEFLKNAGKAVLA